MQSAVIKFSRVLIPDPDSDPRNKFSEDPDYQAEDQARIDAWLNDEWDYVGVVARAEIRIPYGKDWLTTTLDSPGLWGVEDDSGEEYLSSIYEEERETLFGMLEALKTYEVEP
jgi:hypothetical protein